MISGTCLTTALYKAVSPTIRLQIACPQEATGKILLFTIQCSLSSIFYFFQTTLTGLPFSYCSLAIQIFFRMQTFDFFNQWHVLLIHNLIDRGFIDCCAKYIFGCYLANYQYMVIATLLSICQLLGSDISDQDVLFKEGLVS